MKNTFTLLFLCLFMGITQAQRNVVLIIADDLGSDWCGFQENRIDTVNLPNVRKLLSRGVRFSNAWANPVCSPSRAGILTGRYSFRTGVGNVVVNPMSVQLDTAEITIPKLLKNTNAPIKYATANVGKWHLQVQNAANLNNPSKMGYDYYAGCFAAEVTNYYNWSKVTNGVAATSTTYATIDNTNNAITWMNQQTNKPFFLWLAFNAPLFPIHLPPDSLITNHSLSGTVTDIATNQKAYFKVMAEAMDNRIGKIFDWLEANNKLDSTDIIFVGDNGDDRTAAQITNQMRIKGSVYQGGVTVPFIIAGPSVKNPGRVSNALVNLQDIFATVVELTGYTNWQTQIAANKPVDSKSLVPILKNTSTTARPWAFTEVFGTNTASDGKAIRNQDYKLLNFDSGKQEFYNLTNDPNEATNLLNRALTATERTNYNYLCTEMGLLLNKTVCTTVATNELNQKEQPIISPNPVHQLLSVSFSDALSFSYQINAIDGKMLLQGVSTKDISTSELPNGLYLLKIQRQDAVYIEKIVVEK